MQQRNLIRWFVGTTVLSAGLGLLAGGWSQWLLIYLATWSLFGLVALLGMGEELARERFHPPEPGADAVPLRAIRLVALAHLAIGALDGGRWHIAPVPDALRAAGLAGMVLFSALVAAAMLSNRFFSAVVRIQSDRGHRVVDAGPYALVRHPGYVGMIGAMPCSGLVLGSWLSVALGLVYAALMLRRVAFEDAFLHAHLPGYREYAARVRFRLIPGRW